MKFKITQEDQITFLEINGEKLDNKIAPELKSQFILLANDDATGHLVLELGNITFADSSGLSALLLAHRLYRDTDRSLILCNLSERVAKLLEISQLSAVFEIVSSREEAVEQLG